MHWGQPIPVYVLPGLVGSGAAAVLYDAPAEPRRIKRPITTAVTEPDRVAVAK